MAFVSHSSTLFVLLRPQKSKNFGHNRPEQSEHVWYFDLHCRSTNTYDLYIHYIYIYITFSNFSILKLIPLWHLQIRPLTHIDPLPLAMPLSSLLRFAAQIYGRMPGSRGCLSRIPRRLLPDFSPDSPHALLPLPHRDKVELCSSFLLAAEPLLAGRHTEHLSRLVSLSLLHPIPSLLKLFLERACLDYYFKRGVPRSVSSRWV